MSPRRASGGGAGASRGQAHLEWLRLIEVSGPFLSVPVLTAAWPDLEPLDAGLRDALRQAHREWQAEGDVSSWISFVLRDLLGWQDAVQFGGDMTALSLEVAEHETTITPSFTLRDPATGEIQLLGLVSDGSPVARVVGSDWPATPADRLAQLCRARGVELGLATDGRWWALAWAPAGGVTTVAVFDSIAWPDHSERTVVRAFISLLQRRRFFAVPDSQRLPALLRESLKHQEDITEALGVQVRQAVELLVAAFARADVSAETSAAEVYRGAVTVMMRLVFLLFAEESGLLPADNELYASSYSAGGLYAELEQRVADARGNEAELDHTYLAWHRLLALFTVVYRGVSHPELALIAHDGSLFSPDTYPWFPLRVDDRTVLHMLRAVQTVTIAGELRTVSFRTLTVEQIGYVYEGLLSFEGFRAAEVVVGLIGKEGREEEVPLAVVENMAASPDPAARFAETYKDSGIGSVRALTLKLAPLSADERAHAETKLYAVTQDRAVVQRLLPLYRLIRQDLRGDPVVILPGHLYVTESALRASTGTHYTPRFLAEQVAEGALEPLVYKPGPLQTARPFGVETPVGRGDPRPAGRRHRDGLRRVPGRRVQVSRGQAHRSLVAGRQRRRASRVVRLARGVRPGAGRRRRFPGHQGSPRDRRALPLWRRHQRDGRRDGQALAVDSLDGPVPPVHVPGRQARSRRLPARHHVDRAAGVDAPGSEGGPGTPRGHAARLHVRRPRRSPRRHRTAPRPRRPPRRQHRRRSARSGRSWPKSSRRPATSSATPT